MDQAKKRGFLKKTIGKVRDTIKGAASVAAIPFNNLRSVRANADADTLRRARQYDDAPNLSPTGTPTDALKWRTMADEVRMRRIKK